MKTFLMAAAAYMLTFMVVMLAGVGVLKAEEQKKEKGKGGKIEATEEEGRKNKTVASEGVRPLAGLSLYLQKAAERNVDVIKIIMERWQ